MTINEYQKKAHTFSCYEKPISYENVGTQTVTHELDWVYPALGLAEEAGEVAGKFAKSVRDDCGKISEEKRLAIKKELGDVCWFIAELSTLLGLDLEDVMQSNIDKLTDRKQRNVIRGSGDDR
jgi:NTP pyrophosphatase (non-canonical NTP hydrolase)